MKQLTCSRTIDLIPAENHHEGERSDDLYLWVQTHPYGRLLSWVCVYDLYLHVQPHPCRKPSRGSVICTFECSLTPVEDCCNEGVWSVFAGAASPLWKIAILGGSASVLQKTCHGCVWSVTVGIASALRKVAVMGICDLYLRLTLAWDWLGAFSVR